MTVFPRRYRFKRKEHYICNFMDENWIDLIGTFGTRISLPRSVSLNFLYPDDVVSIYVSKDEIQTQRRREGKSLHARIEASVWEQGLKQDYNGGQLICFPGFMGDQQKN